MPQRVRNDAQVRHRDQLGAFFVGAHEGMTLSTIGVLPIGLLLVGAPAGIENIVQDAGATFGIACDGIGRPRGWLEAQPCVTLAAARRSNTFGIQPTDDLAGRHPSGKLFEDAHDDGGLRRQHLLQAFDAFVVAVIFDPLVVAICDTARVQAHFMALGQCIAGLAARRCDLLGIDGAHHADVHRCNHALLAGGEDDAAKFQSLVEAGNVRLPARDAVHRVAVDDVHAPAADGGEKRLHSRPMHRCAGFGSIGEAANLDPLLPR
ncbi:hypothetical protein U1701_17400 [Sphingomonas sp. PB2P19]